MLYAMHTDTAAFATVAGQLLDLAMEMEFAARSEPTVPDGTYTAASHARLASKYITRTLASLAHYNAAALDVNRELVAAAVVVETN